MGVGSYIDPITPDIPAAAAPSQELQFTDATEGAVVPEVLGTAEVIGNFIWYCCNRVEDVTEDVDTGGSGGSSQEVVTGYRYYLTFAIGLCAGPIDEIHAIYRDNEDDPMWAYYNWLVPGESLQRPADGQYSTLSLGSPKGADGTLYFYWGTDNQYPEPLFSTGRENTVGLGWDMVGGRWTMIGGPVEEGVVTGGGVDATLNSPMRGLCYVFGHDVFIGEVNRCPTFRFIVTKKPDAFYSAKKTIGTYDYNPAHAIYEILVDMVGLADADLNTASFQAVADTLYSEGRGISMRLDRQEPAMAYIEEILKHINGILFYGNDQQLHLKLLRDDYVVGNLPTINQDDVLEPPSFSRGSFFQTINQVRVQYTERYSVPYEWQDVWGEGD
jgi:hypothetical protein